MTLEGARERRVRTGGPKDDDEDMDLPVWAGVVPLELVAREPIAEDDLRPEVPTPDYATNYSRTDVAR